MRLSPDEQAMLEESLVDVVWLWALRLMEPNPLVPPSGSALAADQGARRRAELVRLAAMEEIARRLAALGTRAAEEAALYGRTTRTRRRPPRSAVRQRAGGGPPSPRS